MRDSTTPKRNGPLPRDPLTRFWPKVEKTETCWLWTGAKTKAGYGMFGLNRGVGLPQKMTMAHRYSWEIANGPIPPGIFVDHMCHTKACVNPRHLRLADPKQNLENRCDASIKSNTGVRGVSWDKVAGRYRAAVTHNRKHYHVGRYDTLEEAAEAAKAKRLELFTHNLHDRT